MLAEVEPFGLGWNQEEVGVESKGEVACGIRRYGQGRPGDPLSAVTPYSPDP